MDEVLQIPQVFLNVSKGQVASNEDLKASFGTTDHNEIILQILKKGELQVGNKERQAQSDQLHAEIVSLIASKSINPNTKRPYSTTIIDKALSEASFNMSSKPAKIQALEALKLLSEKQVIPIARAQMKIRISSPPKEGKANADKVKALVVEVEDETVNSDEYELVGTIEPGNYRPLEGLIREEFKGKGTLEILETAVVKEGDQL